ncbi:hypothetical protein N7513_001761 [Penicillium frequentans]|nr:hypothetical protein N7513_013193 [Penicillium glabrum]KAJ5523025.1 hypothetical protein N7513_012569 [Penicillium glabrum]KAJ5523026.1 hypothetical protein N7513_012570 [Penicillium glabrum]KAJ5526487.1 hypothetical protein N7513_010646 [Penicillium glabrum]KAJ5537459.1 hypothetical protein N7513_010645 [Penicillium glabrum]
MARDDGLCCALGTLAILVRPLYGLDERDRRNALEIPHLAGPVKPRGRFVDVPGLDDGLLALGLLGLEGPYALDDLLNRIGRWDSGLGGRGGLVDLDKMGTKALLEDTLA